ncbi:CapA family protein [Flexivirga endophytica]|uniref:CapA family protein n=1 Tax=Flexivirga endophytica TaxID=1849103 RepID=UPI0016632C11|nr:CapA family protein [Flexivirga endophytica]
MWLYRNRLSLVAATAVAVTLVGCSGVSSSPDAGTGSTSGSTSVHGATSTSRTAVPSATSRHTPEASSTSATGSTSSALTPAPRKGRPGSVTVAVSGDEIPHPAVLAAARRGPGWDFDPMFAQVAPTIRDADVAICQLETPLGATGADLSHGFVMGAPAAFATGLRRAGFDGCSTANNHTFDQQLPGVRDTRTIMQRAGLEAAGPGPDAAHPGQPAIYRAKGFTIAQLSYSYTVDNTVGNTRHIPPAAPWAAGNLYDVIGVSGIEKDARAARAHGADLVLVSMHWGEEQDQKVTSEQRRFATELLSSGNVDYIIGNHPHVVQECQRIDGRMVNYSLGNALSDQTAGIVAYGGKRSTDAVQDGMIAVITFKRDAVGKVTSTEKFRPTRVDRANGYVIRPVTKRSDPASWQRTTSVVRSGGNSCGATPLR